MNKLITLSQNTTLSVEDLSQIHDFLINLENYEKSPSTYIIINCFTIDKLIQTKKIHYDKSTKNQISGIIRSFITSLNDSQIILFYKEALQLNKSYIFWKIFVDYGLISKLSSRLVQYIFKTHPEAIYECTNDITLSKVFANQIKSALLNSPKNLELFENDILQRRKINLSKETLDSLAWKYFGTIHLSTSLLLGIAHSSNLFSPRTIARAQEIISRHAHEYIPHHFSLNPVFCDFSKCSEEINNHEIEFAGNIRYVFPLKNIGYDKLIGPDASKLKVFIDTTSFTEKFNIEHLFQNLLSFFDFFQKFPISHCVEILYRTPGEIPKYFDAFYSKMFRSPFRELIDGFLKILMSRDSNIDIEDIFEWFFSKYLCDKFSIRNFKYSKSPKKSTYYQKCVLICVELERVIRQYQYYVQTGKLEHGIISAEPNSPEYDQIPSILKNKYLYVYNNLENGASVSDIFAISLAIFDSKYLNENISQNIDNNGKMVYTTLSDLFLKLDLKFHDIPEELLPLTYYCIDYGILYENSQHYIRPNHEIIKILESKFYSHEFHDPIFYYEHSKEEKVELNKLFSNKFWSSESKLLKKSEQDYFSFVLKNNKYPDSLSLRNRYLHGLESSDESKNYEDYLCLLSLMIILIFRINEELGFKLLAEIPES